MKGKALQEKLLAAVALLLALCIAGLLLFWHPVVEERALPRPGLPPGGDFRLDSAQGKIALPDYRGKIVALAFGYTYCPDICPTTLATLADALEQLEPTERQKTVAIFVSVDPARDTVAHLKEYVAFFDPGIIGATGSPAALAELGQRYALYYDRPKENNAGENYIIDHSADIYLIDGQGQLRDKIAHGTTSTAVAQAMRKLLKGNR